MKPTKYNIGYSINLNTADFRDTIEEIITKYPIQEIIETGTFNGLGSTMVFAKTGKSVFSIECNQDNFAEAVKNLRAYHNVCIFHALSLKKEELVKNLINEDFELDVTKDSRHPKPFYMREIAQMVAHENMLELLIGNTRSQLVFLDSAGGVGFLEFKKVMELPKEQRIKKILLLDDCNHIKHKRSVEYLLKMGYNVTLSQDNRYAWCDLSTERDIDVNESIKKANDWMNIK